MTVQEALNRVSGYHVAVNWGHFQCRTNPDSPHDAHIDPRYSFQTGTASLRNGKYRFGNVRATVRINGGTTWVRRSWIDGASTAEKDRLLRHEQGHVDVVGLIMRDLVHDVASLEWDEAVIAALRGVGNTPQARLHYAQRELQRQAQEKVRAAEALIRDLAGSAGADGRYDADTEHGGNQTRQDVWNTMFDRCRRSVESLNTLLWVYQVRSTP